jgi:hypothetical protein
MYKLINILEDNVKIFFIVRDPVSRFIGCINFVRKQFKNLINKRKFKNTYNIIYNDIPDLNIILDKSRTNPDFFEYLISLSPHIKSGIDSYLTYVSDDYIENINDKILMVGCVENLNEDYKKLLHILENDSGYKFCKDTHNLTDKVHKSKKKGIKLSDENIKFIREYCEPDYKCIRKLIKLGYLKQEYINDILNKDDYIY